MKMPRMNMPKLNRVTIASVAVLATAVLVAYLTTRSGEKAAAESHDHAAAPATDSASLVTLTAEAARRIGVTYALVQPGIVAAEVRTVGQVTYDETRVRIISTKIDGWVEQLYVNVTGQPVSVGQPLLAIYSPMLVTAQEELKLAKRLARDVAGGSAEVRRSADEMIQSTRRRLAYWDIPRGELDRVERGGEVMRTLTLRSPASGYVLEKNVLAGQRIMAGDPLYRVADLSTVWVEGEVFERDLAATRVGQAVLVELDAYPAERRQGRISYVYPTLNPETRTVRVRVVLPNPGVRLKPGMYATFRFSAAGRPSALTVPRSAVLVTGRRTLVFVRRPDGRLEPREVTLGAMSDDRAEIIAGVRVGDTVVASATFLIDAESNLGSALGGMGDMPGMEVTVPPVPKPAAGQPKE
ncbi:MAG: efflux RND transporter periplasmic adaptor subunit [Gemmatimonadaceae bacterium]